jgi:hypothetical protein
MTDQRVFLGWVDEDKVKPSPLVDPDTYDGAAAAIWPYGPGGAPHMRIVGTTGGGKSSLLRLLLRGLVRKPGQRGIIIIDGEGAGEFTVLEGMPGVLAVINVNPAADRNLEEGQPTSVELAASAIASTLEEAVERNEKMMRAQAAWKAHLDDPAHVQPPTYRPPAELWLVVDGWGSLRYILNRYLKVKLDPVEDMVMIGRNGRKTDVHLIVADQVTYASRGKDDDGMPSRLKKQLSCSVAAVGALGLTESEGKMAFDDANAGRLVPPVPGGCLMQVGATRVPFVVPSWLNATTADPAVGPAERRAAYRLLPSPETDA